MMKYFGVTAVSLTLRLFGALLMIGGTLGFLYAMGSVNWEAILNNPQAAYGNPSTAWYITKMVLSFGAIISGFWSLVMGQVLLVFVDIARNTAPLKEMAEHSRQTTAFFTRVATKTAA